VPTWSPRKLPKERSLRITAFLAPYQKDRDTALAARHT
jgi:hypothetical protein